MKHKTIQQEEYYWFAHLDLKESHISSQQIWLTVQFFLKASKDEITQMIVFLSNVSQSIL